MKVTGKLLEEKFNEYNKKYFNGSLTKPKFSTYVSETSMGIFNVSERNNKTKLTILIARNINFNEEELRDTLLHEMIHLYVYQNFGFSKKHNGHFADKMNELNQKYGFDIRKDSKHLAKKYLPKKSFLQKIMNMIL